MSVDREALAAYVAMPEEAESALRDSAIALEEAAEANPFEHERQGIGP